MRLILPHTKDGFMATNRYIDTRGRCAAPVTFTEAVVKGLAEGGGLFVPETLPKLSLESILSLAEIPYAKRAAFIYRSFGIDLPDAKIDELMDATYGDRFDDEAICPITSLDGNTHVLELWHGPTSAFKDMALQCLPHFFSASASQLREQGKLENTFLILVATSGDTGKAALEGFRDKEGVQIAVMYPEGGVSDIQYKQMATQAGSNVMVWAVKGNFDDCQTGAKNVFGWPPTRLPSLAPTPSTGVACFLRWFTTFPATLNWLPRASLKLASRLMSAFLLAISATSSLHGTQSRSARLWVPCSAQAMKIAFSPISSIPAATTFPIVSSS